MTAGVLQRTEIPMAQGANNEHHRALFRRGAAANSSKGVLCKRQERRSDHFLDLQPFQPGLEPTTHP